MAKTYHKPSKTLKKKIFFTGRIKTLTGLHIGGSNNEISIGGVDNVVIRNPLDDKPYIPGSSLKGKMRSLIEQSYGHFGKGIGRSDYGPTEDPSEQIVMLFGNAKGETGKQKQNVPSRLIVRDGRLLSEGYDRNSELPYTELKTEVTIDRITATATPRQVERVPAGVEFELQLVLNIWEDGTEKEATELKDKDSPITLPQDLTEETLVQMVFSALRLVQDDFLGGKGSRGSGQVRIGIEQLQERSRDFYLNFSADKSDGYEDSAHQIPEDLQIWATN